MRGGPHEGNHPLMTSLGGSPDQGTQSCGSGDRHDPGDPEAPGHGRSLIESGSLKVVVPEPKGARERQHVEKCRAPDEPQNAVAPLDVPRSDDPFEGPL